MRLRLPLFEAILLSAQVAEGGGAVGGACGGKEKPAAFRIFGEFPPRTAGFR